MTGWPRLYQEFSFIEQSPFGQRRQEIHVSRELSFARPPLELQNGTSRVPAHESRVPIDSIHGARHEDRVTAVIAREKDSVPSALVPVRGVGRNAAFVIS